MRFAKSAAAEGVRGHEATSKPCQRRRQTSVELGNIYLPTTYNLWFELRMCWYTIARKQVVRYYFTNQRTESGVVVRRRES